VWPGLFITRVSLLDGITKFELTSNLFCKETWATSSPSHTIDPKHLIPIISKAGMWLGLFITRVSLFDGITKFELTSNLFRKETWATSSPSHTINPQRHYPDDTQKTSFQAGNVWVGGF